MSRRSCILGAGAVLAAALAAATASADAGSSAATPRRTLVDVASLVAHKPVRVHCLANAPAGGELGLTVAGSSSVSLVASMCRQVRAAIAKPSTAAANAQGLLVLAHEAEHARGFSDELGAECNAVRAVPSVLGRIGTPLRLRALTMAAVRAADRRYWGSRPHSCAAAPTTPPAAAAPAPKTTSCVASGSMLAIDTQVTGLSVTFTAVCPYGATAGQFAWTFGDPGSSDTAVGPVVRHVFLSAGRHVVELFFIDADGHPSSTQTVVTIGS